MSIAHSKVTAQGQISVPLEVRKRLGIGPGSTLEWDEADDQIVVRRAAAYSSKDIHVAIFGTPAAAKSHAQLKEGVRKQIRRRFARR